MNFLSQIDNKSKNNLSIKNIEKKKINLLNEILEKNILKEENENKNNFILTRTFIEH